MPLLFFFHFFTIFLFFLSPVSAQTSYLVTFCPKGVVNATTGCGPVTDDPTVCMYSGAIQADNSCTCVYEKCIRASSGGLTNTLNVKIYKYGSTNQSNCQGPLIGTHSNIPIDNICRLSGGVNGSLINASFISAIVTETKKYQYIQCGRTFSSDSSCGSLSYCNSDVNSKFWISTTECNFDNCFGFLCRSQTYTSPYGASNHNAMRMCLYCAPPDSSYSSSSSMSMMDALWLLILLRYVILPIGICLSCCVCYKAVIIGSYYLCPDACPHLIAHKRKRTRTMIQSPLPQTIPINPMNIIPFNTNLAESRVNYLNPYTNVVH
jgi:hypothetical protein